MAKYPGLPIEERKSLNYDLRQVSDILANAHLQFTVAYGESSPIAKEAEVAVNAVDKLLYSLDADEKAIYGAGEKVIIGRRSTQI